MANYAVPTQVLKPYLPNGCELDLYNGLAYVSLVGFMFKKTKLFKLPIPLLGTFEEINLRFYVIRKEGGVTKRGVVFINETIPYKAVAWVANKLYKEHYTTIPTKNIITVTPLNKQIEYQWKINNSWNSMFVKTAVSKNPMLAGSFEEYIFEHYYGYTKINDLNTEEYTIMHPRWNLNTVLEYNINCNFDKMYGNHFSFLNTVKPTAVIVAEGSEVFVNWKRNKLKLNAE